VQEIFELGRPEQEIELSSYLVRSEIEESAAMAAHCLTYDRSSVEQLNTIRIWPSELCTYGIHAAQTAGETDIPCIDSAHHDLQGIADGFRNLVKHLMSISELGELRFREYRDNDPLYKNYLRNLYGRDPQPRAITRLVKLNIHR
jgi:hypothetical protein